MSAWYFACDSDQHFSIEKGKLDQRKGDYISTYTNLNKQMKLDFLLCPGDMTDHGADDFCIIPPCLMKLVSSGPYGDECEAYIENWVNGIEKLGIPIYEGIGNHDFKRYCYPKMTMAKYVHERHNSTMSWFSKDCIGYYKFEHKGVDFIYTGLYPKNLSWIRDNLPEDKMKPIIFCYHYNTMGADGSYCTWWSEKEMDEFYEVIKGHNVKMIINGHWHVNNVSPWKNIPNVICGGETPVVIKVDNKVDNKVFTIVRM